MAGPRRTRIYLGVGLLGIAAALAGFFTTFIRPVWQGAFHGPVLAHLHGAFVSAWLVLFTTQAWLVQSARTRTHRTLGWTGLAIAPGVVATTIAMGVFAMHRDLAAGGGETAMSTLVGSITSPLIFASLFAAGLANRRKPEFHKRLMLLATLAILWPAFFRFRHYFPAVSRPDWWFAFALPQVVLLGVVVHDKLTHGRVHPVYRYVGSAFAIEAAAETYFFDSPGWRALARSLAAPFL
jgi:hypothetical protein